MSDYLYVKLKNASDLSLLHSYATNKNLIIVSQNQFMPLWYTLRCTRNTIENTLQIANYLFETGNFESSSPDFLFNNNEDLISENIPPTNQNLISSCVTDPNFSQQWGLQNGYIDGINPNQTFNYDINACEAWTISKGLGIKVAVIDGGLDLNNTDMYNNIFNLSYNADTGLSPSQNLNEHGTWVAGIIGSEQNNNYQISGVAPKSKLISVSMSGLSSPQGVLNRINGMNWAMTNGADVMNCSWRASYSLDLLNDAIRNISINGRNGLGTVIVYCAGNYDGIPQHSTMWYPAKSDLNLISVGSTTINGNRYIGSCFGTNLDVVAPGHNIITTASSNGLNYVTGTSFAAPHVSGIAALILSVNPCLSANQVRDIIEKTCQKVGSYAYATTADRPNGTWNIEMGYGLVDAHAAVLLAQAMNSSTLDLMVKDTPTDFGIQPNTTSPILWNSPDIWVRNQQDAVQEHQNPQFNPTVPNYIYVKVTNKSCATSTGAEKLKIYCSIPNYGTTSSSFRSAIAPVNSSVTLIGTVDIPVLSAGQETIVSMPWNVPFFVSCDQTVWNTFLLTKIISPTDLNAFTEVTNTYTNIKNNNNIAA
jgi:serine protease